MRASGSDSSGGGGTGVNTGGGSGRFGGEFVEATGGSGTSGFGGAGVRATGGNSSSSRGGVGVDARGSAGGSGGGAGVVAQGGEGSSGGEGITAFGGRSLIDGGSSGLGLSAIGGNSPSGGFPGDGVDALGGAGGSHIGGVGVRATGGASNEMVGANAVHAQGGGSGSTFGGAGVHATGGVGSGAGNRGGDGIFAQGGFGQAGATQGRAGQFNGDVDIQGHLSKSSGSFKIDHPLDPENKYLYHSFVESPDMLNIYNGLVVLDRRGRAVVTLPEWFESLNRDSRYQLTCIGGFAPVFIAREIKSNRFVIAGGRPGMKVSWQVTGIRQDAYANKNRIKLEEYKTEQERGFYLHPEVFNKPEERGIEWARNPEMMMRQMKDARLKQLEERHNQAQNHDR